MELNDEHITAIIRKGLESCSFHECIDFKIVHLSDMDFIAYKFIGNHEKYVQDKALELLIHLAKPHGYTTFMKHRDSLGQ